MNTKEIPVIEKGIPIPPLKKRLTKEYESVVADMKIGDSFLVPIKRKATASRCIIFFYGSGSAAFRTVDLEYCRVWRIK